MKTNFKKFAAIGLVASMIMSINVSADTTGGATVKDNTAGVTVTGNSTVTSPIYKVALPTTIVVGLDAFELGGKGQIVSADHVIVNRSNVAVEVEADIAVAYAKAVEMVDLASFEALTFVANETKDKVGHFAVTAGEDYIDTSSITTTGTALTGLEIDYCDDSVTGAYIDAKGGSATAAATVKCGSWTFNLAKAEYTGTTISALAASDKGVASFALTGSLNPYAPWAASDVKVTVVYTFGGMIPDDYDAAVAGTELAPNLFKYTPSV